MNQPSLSIPPAQERGGWSELWKELQNLKAEHLALQYRVATLESGKTAKTRKSVHEKLYEQLGKLEAGKARVFPNIPEEKARNMQSALKVMKDRNPDREYSSTWANGFLTFVRTK